ncbi:MAG: hypothetical protein FD135_4347 [Comamonadaceae bacterium]|nr:MAG: hypothetical protein FD135_4347 [Comamonadaceae bacterium]
MEEWKEKISMKRNDVESLINALADLNAKDKIGYHDLKRIFDVLPKADDLEIKPNPAVNTDAAQ